MGLRCLALVVMAGAAALEACADDIDDIPASEHGTDPPGSGVGTGAANDASANANDDNVGSGDADVDPSTPKKRLFVTLGTHDGNLGGAAGGDTLCQNAANAANAGGQFIAYLSTPAQTAIARLTSDGPWYAMDRQTLIFTGKTTGAHPVSGAGPAAPIVLNELAQPFANDETYFWTGTAADGAVATDHCLGWTSNVVLLGPTGMTGKAGATDSKWTAHSNASCFTPKHVLCFEQ